jgi:hypothetical protein
MLIWLACFNHVRRLSSFGYLHPVVYGAHFEAAPAGTARVPAYT